MSDHHACVHPDSIPVPGKPLTGRQLYYLSSLHRAHAASARFHAYELENEIAALNIQLRQLQHDLKQEVDRAEQEVVEAGRYSEEAGCFHASELETEITARNIKSRQLQHDLEQEVDRAEQEVIKAERYFEEAGRVSREERAGR
ncbi:uncharacterized protein BDV17DRAFT_296751 [Aspergillus undulatus]|uniref:uncharacterized protein n=1 Tax=Aspergillus undulatus TaxID=1810928 RepID=UPI003CCD07EA